MAISRNLRKEFLKEAAKREQGLFIDGGTGILSFLDISQKNTEFSRSLSQPTVSTIILAFTGL